MSLGSTDTGEIDLASHEQASNINWLQVTYLFVVFRADLTANIGMNKALFVVLVAVGYSKRDGSMASHVMSECRYRTNLSRSHIPRSLGCRADLRLWFRLHLLGAARPE